VIKIKLFLNTKKMNFDEENNEIEHEIILAISDLEFYGYDLIIDLKDDDKFIEDTLKIKYKKDKEGKDIIEDKQFKVRADGWDAFPLYEIVDDKIVRFDYTKYAYFANTVRRMALAFKINDLYNPPSEAKIQRQTLKTILDNLGIVDEGFEKYNTKIEELINKNPKEGK